MTAKSGQRLAQFRLVEEIGAGGMGVVWKATDTTLGRDVALKFLPDSLASDPERLARFEREARLLASLNHPHIAAVHGFHTAEGRRFLEMELAVGESLFARLERGPVPPADAIAIARQIADALEAAHERGVIHRDLKPSNIMVGGDGAVKVLDFGLAKALEGGEEASPISNLSQSPTITGQMTSANVILGTAAYMSPEQARGRAADKRADIWAFGVILFEMLTNRRLFHGETVSDTLAAVLRAEPEWGSLPPDTPRRARELLTRCLVRDVRLRMRDIGEARIVLDRIVASPEEEVAATLGVRGGATWKWMLGLAAVALIAAAGGALLASRTTRPLEDVPPRRFVITEAGETQRSPYHPAISPDGRMAAYLREDTLWVRDLDELEPRFLVTSSSRLQKPFWSPDSRYVGYIEGTRIMKVPATSGPSELVSDLGKPFMRGSAATWGADGVIVCSRGREDGLLAVPALGGDARTILVPDTTRETGFHDPWALPGGRGVLYSPRFNEDEFPDIEVLVKGKRKTVLHLEGQTLFNPAYSPTGHLLFERRGENGGVWAAPFSLEKLAVTGEPFLVAPDAVKPTVSDDGTLTYLSTGDLGKLQIIRVDRQGGHLEKIGVPSDLHFGYLDLSPDGSRLVVGEGKDERDLWIYDLPRGTRTRLTFEPGDEKNPAWTPDAQRIAYVASPPNCQGSECWSVLLRSADGTGNPDTVVQSVIDQAISFSPDGRFLLHSVSAVGGPDLAWTALDGEKRTVIGVSNNEMQRSGSVSPDGRYVAYASSESGSQEIYLKRFPGAEGKWQVSIDGGSQPHWNAVGDRLFYIWMDGIYEVDVGGGTAPVLSTPRKLFDKSLTGNALPTVNLAYDLGEDGNCFVMVIGAGGELPQSVIVAQNWLARFRKAGK